MIQIGFRYLSDRMWITFAMNISIRNKATGLKISPVEVATFFSPELCCPGYLFRAERADRGVHTVDAALNWSNSSVFSILPRKTLCLASGLPEDS
jgi:hypothetical protein